MKLNMGKNGVHHFREEHLAVLYEIKTVLEQQIQELREIKGLEVQESQTLEYIKGKLAG